MPKKSILNKTYQPGDEHQLRWFDAGLVRFMAKYLSLWERYFRYDVVGINHIPRKGGALLALNHGFFFIDIFLFGKHLFVNRKRRARAVAEHLSWKLPIVRELFLNMGIVDGTPWNAMRILKKEHVMIVCPGGAKEASRSSRQKYELMWDDRYGFIKVAIAAGVPIIPCMCIGIDDAYVMLVDAYHRWKDTFIPLPVFFGLGLMPLPVKLTHYVGRPVTHNYKPYQHKDMDCVMALHKKVLDEAERVKEEGLKRRKLFGFL
jgi:1-acyl-sn-glycerol-3-phosphate acyltransferase